MSVICPNCGSPQTAAVYFHKCDRQKRFFTVKLDPVEQSGRPEPAVCPDGLVDGIPDHNTPGPLVYALTPAHHVTEARLLYCYNCGAVTVY